MRYLLLVSGFVVASSLVFGDEPTSNPQVPVPTAEKPMSFWMKQKLDYSKNILEALTSEDFKQLETQARQMHVVGKIEGFVRRSSAVYTQHQQSFDFATQDIIQHAKDRNIEGATLAFHQLTTSCVQCHKSMRMQHDLDTKSPPPPVK